MRSDGRDHWFGAPEGAVGRAFGSLVGRFGRPASIVLLLLGPLLGVLAYQVADGYVRHGLQARYQEVLSRGVHAISQEASSYVEALHSLRSLFRSSEVVERHEFAQFATDVLDRHATIQALEWVPRVPHAEREAHEAAARAQGLTGYRILDLVGPGRTRPAAVSDVYYPVFFALPRGANESALGLNLNSEPVRRRAIARAAASDVPEMTDPLVLVQEQGSSRGALLLLAVREKHRPIGTSEDAPLRGFVLAVFRFENMVRAALFGGDGDADLTACVEVLDTGGGQPALSLCRTAPPPDGAVAGFVAEQKLIVAGHEWIVRGTPSAAFLVGHRGTSPVIVGVVVFLIWELFASLLLVGMRAWHFNVLHRKDSLVHSVLHSLTEGVVVADSDGHMQLVNEAARQISGMEPADARPGELSEWCGCYLPDGETAYPENHLPLMRALRGETIREEQLLIRNENVPEGVWVSVSGTPLRNEAGEMRGGVVVLRDVTARKESDDALRRLSNAVDQTADAVFITGRDGRIQYVNPAFETITGYPPDESLGSSPRILRSGEHSETYYDDLWSTILGGDVFRGTTVNRKKNGDLWYSEQTITPIKGSGGQVTHFVAVCKDMTTRRRVQEQDVEMRLAASVQEKLYPRQAPDVRGLDMAGAVFPAEATCGDYYDYVDLREGCLGLVVGDVCGHGLGPALVMAETRAYLRSLAATELDLGEVLRRVNDLLLDDLMEHLFVTLAFVCIDRTTREFSYVSAGHTPAYVLDPEGRVKAVLSATGVPLGLFEDRKFEHRRGFVLDEGDVLVMLTDGATESRAPDGSLLEEDGVLDAVRAHLGGTAQEIVDGVRSSIHEFTGGQPPHDDITLLVCKASG